MAIELDGLSKAERAITLQACERSYSFGGSE